ncbi:MAG: hypothetical protein PHG95_01485 [Patescibacteria group bacterium]|nr:hypothetical protein [Patescibacteria group bacterium]
MKKLVFLLVIVVIFSSCKKDDNITPPPPTPFTYNAQIVLTFSDLPQGQGVTGFSVPNCVLYEIGTQNALSQDVGDQIVYPNKFVWDLDTAFVRQYRGKTIGLYFVGCIHQNGACTGYGGEYEFTLKVKPEINEFYFEITINQKSVVIAEAIEQKVARLIPAQ